MASNYKSGFEGIREAVTGIQLPENYGTLSRTEKLDVAIQVLERLNKATHELVLQSEAALFSVRPEVTTEYNELMAKLNEKK